MSRLSPVRQALAFALMIVTSRGLHAQGAAPPPPDTVLKPPVGQPDYVRSLHEIAAPLLIAQRPYRVMLASAATAAGLDEADILGALARACPSGDVASARAGRWSDTGATMELFLRFRRSA